MSCLGCDGRKPGLRFCPSSQVLCVLGEGIVSPQSNTEETSVARRFLHLNVFEALGHQDTTSLAVKELPPTAMVDVNYASWVSWAMERRTEKKHEDKLQNTRKIPSLYIGINWDKSEVWDKTLQLYK